MGSPARVRRLAQFALFGVAAVLIAILFAQSRWGIIFGKPQSYDNHIELLVPQAMGVIPGERMVAAGGTIGEITEAEVTKQGLAHIVMGLDDTVWPLPDDSTLTLRMGGTIKRTDRFIEVAPGKSSKFFEDGDQVPVKQFTIPVEYGDLFNVFDPETRRGLNDFFANGGPAMKAAAKPLRSALDVAPPVLDNAAAVFRDVSYDTQALSTLVSSTAEVTGAIARSNPGLQTLITGGAKTFTAASADAKALQTTLEDAGEAFRVDGAMFAHGALVLPKVAELAERIDPALTELDNLAGPLNATLQKLITIEPNAVDTLRTVRRAAPTVQRLLTSARTNLMPQLGATAKLGAKELNCIRPFTPDIMGFLQGWGGFFGPGFDDPKVHMLHTLVSLLPFPNTMPLDSEQITSLFPNLEIQNPHAPGQGWNQPWFLPECGVTPEGFEAKNDPESGTYDAKGSKTVPYPMG